MDSQVKKYHAFISHSSQDKDEAKRLALDLQGRGYSVWFDEWEVLVGHNIVDEVFGAIKQSFFMVGMLSKASIQSRWVDEELTAAKTREIEGEQVVILPARIESCEIPPALSAKRYADFTDSWDYGVEEIIRAIEGHKGNQQSSVTVSHYNPAAAYASFGEMDKWRENRLPEMIDAGFAEGQPFKDVLIGPIDGKPFDLEKPLLKPLVDNCRVQLANWGGLPFPFQKSHDTQEVYLQTGLRYMDPKLILYGPETFHFWQIDSHLNFVQRSPFGEDFIQGGPNDLSLSGTLVRSWTLADIVCPLIFAKNILGKFPELERIGIKFIWSGLKGCNLITLLPISFRLRNYFQCQVSDWIHEAEVTSDTNIADEALKAATELFWLFGWVPETGILDQALETMANGRFVA